MKIADITTEVFEKALDGSLRNPRFVWTVKRSLLTFVTTDTGLIGVGESWVDGGDPESVAAFIEHDLKPRLVGQDPRLPELYFRRAIDMTQVSTRRSQTWAGMSAIDIALWDIKAQAAGEPLWRMLGGHDPRVMPYASGGLYKDGQSVDDFAQEYAAFVRQGFKAVKIKVGGDGRGAGGQAARGGGAGSAPDGGRRLQLRRADGAGLRPRGAAA
jgi:L-alanine-DL-glutamate epimerase-like enolase superfamily enzyme